MTHLDIIFQVRTLKWKLLFESSDVLLLVKLVMNAQTHTNTF